ncbi:cyanophycinase [Yeosuana marina]|uniref:cyanophycinase n=1 Tax=Yeosuana marina TaxID=1565536 RepID=UPI0030EB7769|tara:strand:+ start:9944 stop:11002 length:1059 start_codon:yes stop_codon:yes gene_type:complete
MKNIFIVFLLIFYSCDSNDTTNESSDTNENIKNKPYVSYLTGSKTDLLTNPLGGICLMGGATENDNAMTWFLERADGGDVLILRTSGSNGYNDYMYKTLGVQLNSVETILIKNKEASYDTDIQDKIKKAEAIWFAGGNQWEYISFWRDTPITTLINEAIEKRNVVIGGTSAGMAILGGYYFSAKNGTITSSEALNNPYDPNMTVENESFIKNHYLTNVITDTHYDNPNRKGRHVTFLARIVKDFGVKAKGIACDESTAVCVETNGVATIFGKYPLYDDNAYFIKVNDELANVIPENCTANNPLTWNFDEKALKVYAVKGTNLGTNTFDLTNWNEGSGGEWLYWYVDNGVLND